MNEQIAWERFKNTGKILDYLNYIQLKDNYSRELGGNRIYEAEYGWLNNNGKKYFR